MSSLAPLWGAQQRSHYDERASRATTKTSRQRNHGARHRTEQRKATHAIWPSSTILTSRSQRAFRERKERHVRELEIQLNSMTAKSSSLQTDVNRLRTALQRAQTENKILRASAACVETSAPPSRRTSVDNTAPLMFGQSTRGDGQYSCPSLSTRESSGTTTTTSSGSNADSSWAGPIHRYLEPDAAWDLLQSHPLFKQGLIDVGKVCERLKWLARCEASSGPVFDEVEVMQIIEEAAQSTQMEPP